MRKASRTLRSWSRWWVLAPAALLFTPALPARADDTGAPARVEDAGGGNVVSVDVDDESVADLLRLLQGAHLPIVVGNAQDLTQLRTSIHLSKTPAGRILQAICREANVNCQYDDATNIWYVNREQLITSGLGTGQSTTPSAHTGQDSGTPVDTAPAAGAPPTRMVMKFLKVRNLEPQQIVNVIMSGDTSSIQDPLSLFPFRPYEGYGYQVNGRPAESNNLSTYMRDIARDQNRYADAMNQFTNDPQLRQVFGNSYRGPMAGPGAPSGPTLGEGPGSVSGYNIGAQAGAPFTPHNTERSGDSFAQFPGGGGPFGGGGGGPFGGGGGGRFGGGGGFAGGGGGPFGGGGGNPFGGGANPGGGPGGGAQQGGLASLLPQNTQLIPYPPTNSIIAITTPDGVDQLERLIAQLDVPPQYLLIQVVQMNISDNDLRELGFDYTLSTPLLNVNTDNGVSRGSINVNYFGTNVAATMSALETSSRGRVVNRPRVILPNGVLGTIADIETEPIILPPVTAGFGGQSTGAQVVGIPTGPSFTFLPRLNRDGTVTIFSQILSTTITGIVSVPGGGQVPLTSTVSIPVPGIRVVNGDTIALGGLSTHRINHTQTGIPILQHLPFIGPFFRSTTDSDSSTEVLFFITINLIDVHGQIIPGGPDAVKRAMGAEEASPVVATGGGLSVPGGVPGGAPLGLGADNGGGPPLPPPNPIVP